MQLRTFRGRAQWLGLGGTEEGAALYPQSAQQLIGACGSCDAEGTLEVLVRFARSIEQLRTPVTPPAEHSVACHTSDSEPCQWRTLRVCCLRQLGGSIDRLEHTGWDMI
jgi:hypothetical protein